MVVLKAKTRAIQALLKPSPTNVQLIANKLIAP